MQRIIRSIQFIICTILLAALVVAAVPAAAQAALTETFAAEDGSFAFNYPTGWTVQVQEKTGFVTLSDPDGALSLTFVGPAQTAALGATTPAEAVTAFIAQYKLTAGDVQEMTVGGVSAAAAAVNSTSQSINVTGVELSNGSLVVVLSRAVEDMTAVGLPIVMSLNVPVMGTATVRSTPCTVSTDQEQFATLRVGPGTNRTELTALPANQSFTVVGQAAADDGSLWWKLVKEEAAPKTAAAEIWVAQDQVTAAGDCDNVGDEDAPPIIPITQSQNTETTAGEESSMTTAPVTAPLNTGGGSGVFITYPEWHNQLPAGMRAASVEKAQYVASVSTSLNTVESCTYVSGKGDQFIFRRDRVDFTVQVINAATGGQIAQQTFVGGEPGPCPPTLLMNSTLNGPAPDFNQVLTWLRGVLGM